MSRWGALMGAPNDRSSTRLLGLFVSVLTNAVERNDALIAWFGFRYKRDPVVRSRMIAVIIRTAGRRP
jgi:hypothetical protein